MKSRKRAIENRTRHAGAIIAIFLSYVLVAALTGCDSQLVDPDTAAIGSHAVNSSEVTKPASKGPPLQAIMQVGRSHVGSPFPPPEGHDASTHAQDAMQPRTVVISAGGVVTFHIEAFHNVAIYEDGTQPEDIDTSQLEPAGTPFPFPPLVNDPSGRLARTDLALPGTAGPFEWTFDTPGRYLVICEVLPHFTDGDMYGWVIVQ